MHAIKEICSENPWLSFSFSTTNREKSLKKPKLNSSSACRDTDLLAEIDPFADFLL